MYVQGVPGVLPEKLAEGLQARHCALSLVGEPIMYPEINKFVRLLHSKVSMHIRKCGIALYH
jgi:tRNA wybutosine-synthesizing protein 1